MAQYSARSILAALSLSVSAASASTPAVGAAALPYAEFQKVISVRSALIPLNHGRSSLALAVLPGDPYANLYELDHSTKTFTKLHDAGRSIAGLSSDYRRENFYLGIDNDGDENYQIYRFDLKTKKTKKIYGNDGFKTRPLDFSRDGSRLYLLSNHENKGIFSVYVLDLASKKLTRLTDGKESFDGGLLSNKEKHLLLVKALGNNEQQVYHLDLGTKRLSTLLAEKATVFSPAFFSADEATVYVNTDKDSDRTYCAKVALAAPKKVVSVLAAPDKDVDCSYDDRVDLSFVTKSFDGRTALEIYKGILAQPLATPVPDKSIVAAITPVLGSTKVIARVLTADSPGDYFQFDVSKGKQAGMTRLTNLNQSSIKPTDFAKSYDVRYKSFDGREIHGIVYAKEDWVKGTRKYPVILWPHGGPDHHEEHSYNGLFQYWALNGYVVFAPNFRGSTGYGKKFETLNDKDWGGGHIKDLIHGKREVAKLPYVDAERMYIVGASFGGFSTLSAITQYPEEFDAAVAIVAIGNLFTFFKSIPPDPAWQAEFRTEMGDPEKDKQLYTERSPYTHATRIKIPLQIYQADNDVRTVKAEMDQFVAKLRQHEIPVTYEVLEKEGHSLSRSESRVKVFEGTVKFLNGLGAKGAE